MCRLLDRTCDAYSHEQIFQRARTLALAELLCLGRHTISGLLTTSGQQFHDWSAAYRTFEHSRVDCDRLFDVARDATVELLDPRTPIVALLDDTLIEKRGHRVDGTAWRRDPLGPPFTTNLIWAQRFLQLSLALPDGPCGKRGRARGIPIDLVHAPTMRKPSRRASADEWADYHAQSQNMRLSARAVERLRLLRAHLDHDPRTHTRPLILCADASYSNRTVFSALPERTVMIGRIRKDAALWSLPEPSSGTEKPRRGRIRRYGDPLPTPEQMRADPSIPWKQVRVFAAGKQRTMYIKSIGPVRWRSAGPGCDLRLIIIRPLRYQHRRGAHPLYRQPGYLLCSDPSLDDEQIVQFFLWRWEIELNFREEKTLLGAGEAQVRTPQTVAIVPSFKISCYAFLLLAERHIARTIGDLPAPSWQRGSPDRNYRRSTSKLISLLRADIWASAFGQTNFSGFVPHTNTNSKPKKISDTLKDAVLYASR